MTAATTAETHLIAGYKKYKQALKVIDDARVRADELLKAAVKQMLIHPMSTTRCNAPNHPNFSSAASTTLVNSGTTLHSSDRVAPLAASERGLLIKHDGCFKCRTFYTTHKSVDCLNSFPNKSSYVPLTESSALASKKCQPKKDKVAPAAAIVPTAVIMPSAVLGNGSDSEYIAAPFYTPHFFLDVFIGGPTASCQHSVCSLIDHRSDSVLIDPILANRLGLVPKKLPALKEVTMAVGDRKEIFIFDEWVPVTIISADQAWTLLMSPMALCSCIFAFLHH
jgi:hypothetical protein